MRASRAPRFAGAIVDGSAATSDLCDRLGPLAASRRRPRSPEDDFWSPRRLIQFRRSSCGVLEGPPRVNASWAMTETQRFKRCIAISRFCGRPRSMMHMQAPCR